MLKIIKENKEKIFIYSLIGAIIVFSYVLLTHIRPITDIIVFIFKIITPFILGYGIAFLAFPIRRRLLVQLNKTKMKKSRKKSVAAFVSFAIIIGVISVLLAIIVPQIVDSIVELTNQLPNMMDQLNNFIDYISLNIPQFGEYIQKLTMDDVYTFFSNIQGSLFSALPSVLGFSYSIVSGLFNVLVAIIVALYVLYDKDVLDAQFRRAIFFVFKKDNALFILSSVKVFSDKFNGFLIGKTIDSLIIGVLCYIGMTVLNFPFAPLISTIIGITNMIPVFGPFIGAVPGAILIFFVNPIQTLWFGLFVLALQQLDGNIIGPYILKDSMKLPLFWVMFSIVLGGGLFGPIGMLLGLPIFSSVYTILGFVMDKKVKHDEVADIEVPSI